MYGIRKWLGWCLLALLGVINASIIHAQVQASSDSNDTEFALDEVVVTGVRAGPRMWRVAKDGHVLWVLGVLDPLPKQLEWQSEQVNTVLAESQAVLLDGMNVSPDANLFAKLGLYLQWRRLQKNPDKQTLQQILPPELYARFAVLKQRYAKGDDDLERLRPILAAAKLYQAGIESIGLNARRVVGKAVEKQAKQRGIKPYTVDIKVAAPRELLDSLSNVSTEAEVRCLAATVSRLESDLNVLRERANAWALGDIATLRSMVDSDNRVACWDVITSVPRLKELTDSAKREWISAAEASLQQHQTSLALCSIRELLATDGVLAQFRTKGYEVVGP
jgi:uncharacterized protein YbaP (TraB family)